MYSDFAVSKYLHNIQSGWIFISITYYILTGNHADTNTHKVCWKIWKFEGITHGTIV